MFHDALTSVDVGTFTGAQCTDLLGELARVRKACEAVEAALALRASGNGAHRRAGYAAPADWYAALSGTTPHAARLALETIGEVEECPTTRDALFGGDVSMAQAREIAHTEQIAPGHEAELAELASGASLRRVRKIARELRAAAIPADELYERQHAARSLAHWRDELGMDCILMKLLPQHGRPFMKRINERARRLRRESKSLDPFEALAADAFVSLFESKGGSGTRPDLVLVCDVAAWLRRHAHEGEAAKIVGGGPLPVSVIEALSENAFFKVVLHDGVQVQTVAHYGRSIPAHVRTALELGMPPQFDGPCCSQPNCDREHGLEIDHVDPLSCGGPTNAENLDLKCGPEHDEKTRRERAAGRLGGRAP